MKNFTFLRVLAIMAFAVTCFSNVWAQNGNQSDITGNTGDPTTQKTDDEEYQFLLRQKGATLSIDSKDSAKAKEAFEKMQKSRRFEKLTSPNGGFFALNQKGPSIKTRDDDWLLCVQRLQVLEMQMGAIGLKSLPSKGTLFIKSFKQTRSLLFEMTAEIARFIELTETYIQNAQDKHSDDALKSIDLALEIVSGLVGDVDKIGTLLQSFAKASG